MKYAVIDTETTGLDFIKHEMIEIGAIVFDEHTLEIEEQFEIKIKPEHPERGEAAAFKVNGYTPEAWADAPTLQEAMEQFSKAVVGAKMLAYNLTFDWSFLEAAYRRSKVHNTLYPYQRLDLLSMAYSRLHGTENQPKSWKLKDVCTALDVPPEDNVHRAVAGAMKGYEVYKALMTYGKH